MTKKRSSLITHEGEINGCGNITYLKAPKNEHHAPLSQGNVSPERNFSNATSVAQGFNPVVNDPQNLNSITQLAQGFVVAANRVVVSNDSTGMFRYSTMLNEQNITDDSNIQLASSRSNPNTTANINAQWLPLGDPSGAKWKYYENGSPVSNRWIEYNGGWYYLGADQYMVTGWMELGGKWFYLKTNIIKGAEKDGKMAIGWLMVDGNWYYFKEEGSAGYMVTDWRKIDG